ncbi:hypothetical protein ACM66B_001821 [Microbotryomycetes sp. NB124-2]
MRASNRPCGADDDNDDDDEQHRPNSPPSTRSDRPLTVLTPASPDYSSSRLDEDKSPRTSAALARRFELVDRDRAVTGLLQTSHYALQETMELLQVPSGSSDASEGSSSGLVARASASLADSLVAADVSRNQSLIGPPSPLETASVGDGFALQQTSVLTHAAPVKKLSNTQKFLRKARSFGTSPLLGSSATFGSTSKSGTNSPSPSPSPTFGAFPTTSAQRLSPTLAHVAAFGGDGGGAPRSGSTSTSMSPAHSPTLASVSFESAPMQHDPSSRIKNPSDFNPGSFQALDGEAGNTNKRKSTFRRSTFSMFRRNDSAKSPTTADMPLNAGVHGSLESSQPPTIPPLPSMPSRMSWGFGPSSSPSKSTSSSPVSSRTSGPAERAALGAPTARVLPPPFRRSSSTGSPTASIKRDTSWSSSINGELVASPQSELSPALVQNLGSLRVVETPSGRKVLTRAGRSNSDGPTRASLSSLTLPAASGLRFATEAGSARASSTIDLSLPSQNNDGLLRSRPPSPLKPTFSPTPSPVRRPLTADPSSSTSSRGGMLNAVAGLFAGSSGPSSNHGSTSMSRSSSAASSSAAEPSEFGALFGGPSSSSSKRKRGLSVGDRIFSVTKDTRKRADSSSSLHNSWVPPQAASTLSTSAATNLQVPTPDASTPMPHGTRSRASTDPKRLSSSSVVSSGSYFPPFASAASRTSGSMTSPPDSPDIGQGQRRLSYVFGGSGAGTNAKASASPPTSRKTSFSHQQQARSRSTSIKVEVESGETPAAFVARLRGLVSKARVLQVLASSADPFYAEALKLHLETYDFTSDPLDIAIRIFLMDSSLPTEAQQIDRVMEALARRYTKCNPDIFSNSDTPYVLAFSFIMLSTDHFNPNNKSKMTRADYVRNTKIDDVTNELLEYFYDQITLAPFVHVDEDVAEFGMTRPEFRHASSSLFGKGTSSSTAKAKLDLQALVASGEYRNLRLDIASVIPERSPFSYTGTTSFFDATSLHKQFALAPVLQIVGRARSKSSASSGPVSAETNGAELTPVPSNTTYVPMSRRDTAENGILSSIKVTKIGTLSRKEDLIEGGRKSSSRKWKGWTVILTSSQLLFFKDAPIWAALLQQEIEKCSTKVGDQVPVFTIQAPFKPDAVLSLAHIAAVYDSTYSKYANVFRLVAPAGRQYLFQTTTKDELNSWLHAINYAASFKSAGLKLRPLASKSTTEEHKGLSVASQNVSITGASSDLSESPMPSSPSGSSFRAESLTSSRASSLDNLLLNRLSTENMRAAKSSHDSLSRGHHSSLEVDAATSDDVELLVKDVVTQSSTVSRDTRQRDAADGALGPLVLSRADHLRATISQLESEIEQVKARLRQETRAVSNLAVLTPFRTSTRDRIVAAIPPIEKRVRQIRMRMATLLCHREVLSRDLLVEDREDRPVRHGSHRRRSSQRKRATSPNRTPRAFAQQWSPRRGNTAPHAAMTDGPAARDSLDSVAQSFYDAHQSLTDDELDRLKPPPPMQRSQTETLWASSNSVAGRLRSGSAPSEDEFAPTLRPNVIEGSREASPLVPDGALQLADDPTTPKISDVRKSFDEAVASDARVHSVRIS